MSAVTGLTNIILIDVMEMPSINYAISPFSWYLFNLQTILTSIFNLNGRNQEGKSWKADDDDAIAKRIIYHQIFPSSEAVFGSTGF